MSQIHTSPLQKALDTVESLPPEDQETLIEIIQRRLVEWRRTEIARHAEATLRAVREGQAHSGSFGDLKRDLLAES